MNIHQLIEIFQENGILVQENIQINKDRVILDITDNSKDVIKESVFFSKGAHFKEEYLISSMEKGALCFVTEKSALFSSNANGILVKDIRIAMALAANVFFESAWKKLKLVGITGTKGKSTTTYLLKSIIDAYCLKNGKMPAGVLSSIENFDGNILEESHLTTPEPINLHRHFHNMVTNNIEYCVMEVSSQALKYNRVQGIVFNFGGFLNIGRDHISDIEHSDFYDYFTSKIKLFDVSKSMIVNDTISFKEVNYEIEKFTGNLEYFGFTDKSTVRCTEYKKQKNGFIFSVDINNKIEEYFLPMAGVFNIENALCAIGIAKKLEIPYIDIFDGLKNAKVSGRMELFSSHDEKIIAIVDYAHNKLSFEKLYESVKKEYPNYEITTIFGCPGGKAQERRKDLGEISGLESNRVIITEEDPGEESLAKICEEIYVHAKDKNSEVEIVLDREEAIKKAFNSVSSNKKILLITGKGRETRQKRGSEYVTSKSDVDIVIETLNTYNLKTKNK